MSMQNDKERNKEYSQAEDEIDLIDLVRVLWRRKWIIVVGTGLVTVLVFAFVFFSPRTYKMEFMVKTPEWQYNDFKIFTASFFKEKQIRKLAQNLAPYLETNKEQLFETLNQESSRDSLIEISTVPQLEEKGDQKNTRANILVVTFYYKNPDNAKKIEKILIDEFIYPAIEQTHFNTEINEEIKKNMKENARYVEEKRTYQHRIAEVTRKLKAYKEIRRIYGDENLIRNLSLMSLDSNNRGEDNRGEDNRGEDNRGEDNRGEEYKYFLPVKQHISALEMKKKDLEIENQINQEKKQKRDLLLNYFNTFLDQNILSSTKAQSFLSQKIKSNGKKDTLSTKKDVPARVKENVAEYLEGYVETTLASWKYDYPRLRQSAHTTQQAKGTVKKTAVAMVASGFLSVIIAFLVEFVARHREELTADSE